MDVQILLIEDNRGDARLVVEALSEDTRTSYNVTVVDLLGKAIETLASARFDVVLLDLSLPDSHGLGTLAEIRSVAPDTPVVILTGYEDEVLALRSMRSGAQDYLVKGQVDGRALARSIRYAIERRVGAPLGSDVSPHLLADLRRHLDVLEAEHTLLKRVVGREPDEAPPTFLPGTMLAKRYRFERHVGSGRYGDVHLAHDIVLERRVVIKVLHAAESSEAGIRNFLKEARLAASLEHPNVVRVYDFGYAGHAPYLVMEYVVGGSLEDRLRAGGPLPPEAVVRYGGQLLAGLGYIHSRGVLHRDLKPANILLSVDDEVKVVDFGLALVADDEPRLSPGEDDVDAGTPAYVSPEAVRGEPLTALSDLYSAGAVLYQLVSGRAYIPLADRTVAEIRRMILEEMPRPPTGCPEALASVILRALAKEPKQRFESAAAMREALLAVGG